MDEAAALAQGDAGEGEVRVKGVCPVPGCGKTFKGAQGVGPHVRMHKRRGEWKGKGV